MSSMATQAIYEGRHIARFLEHHPLPPDLPTKKILWNWLNRDASTMRGWRMGLLDRIRQLPARSFTNEMTGSWITWGHLIAFLGMTHLNPEEELVLPMPLESSHKLVEITYRVDRIFN